MKLNSLISYESEIIVIFITVLFPRHTSKAARENTINLIHTLRDYLHYHIKCSKVRNKSPPLAYCTVLIKHEELIPTLNCEKPPLNSC